MQKAKFIRIFIK